jgi:uncharacterized protein YegL
MADQLPYEALAFPDPILVENPSERCPVVLLVDTSGSMAGNPIRELNEGLVALKDSLSADSLAAQRVEIAVVTFAPVQTIQDFISPASFVPPQLAAKGDTPMGAAIAHGLDLLSARKAAYKAAGVGYYRPWVFLLTDGAPTDAWSEAAKRVHDGDRGKNFMFWSVGVENANMDILAQIAPPERQPVKLKGLAFRDMFQWLSSSLKTVSRSRVDDAVSLADPTAGPKGWATTT